MSVLSIYTKRVNLAESPAVRWWGVAGARWFWLGWGALMYAFLTFTSGYGLSALAWAEDDRSPRLIPYLAGALIVLAASLLTRMLMRVLDEFRSLESPDRPEGTAK